MNTKNLITAFKIVAVIEALTWVALLIGMYLKRAQDMESATMAPGMAHGIVFIVLVVLTLLVARVLKWDLKTLALGLVATVLPFCSVVFEVWAQRVGKLEAPAVTTRSESAEANAIRG